MVTHSEVLSAIQGTIEQYQGCDDTLLPYLTFNLRNWDEDLRNAIKKTLLPKPFAAEIAITSDPGQILFDNLEMSGNGRLTYDRCFVGFVSAAHEGIFDTDRPYDDDIERRLQEAFRLAAREHDDELGFPVVELGNDCFNIPMGDSMWFYRNMHIPFEENRFHHLPVEHLMPLARQVLSEWRYAVSSGGMDDLTHRMRNLKWHISEIISPVANASLMDLRIMRIEWLGSYYALHLECEMFCLDHTLDPSMDILTIVDHKDHFDAKNLQTSLASQKRKNTAKRRAGNGWIMVDKILGEYLRPLLLEMDQKSFDHMFLNFEIHHRSGTAKRDEFISHTNANLPEQIQSITLKDGVLSGAVRISEEVSWRSGKIHWKRRLPSAMSTAIKGRPAREVIDIALLEGMKVSGSRPDPNGGHIFSLTNSQVRYKDIFTK
tara:strand:+ start:988 stop:2283 length:1296 start_codon:yes stop_codon:yes gene_type:complete